MVQEYMPTGSTCPHINSSPQHYSNMSHNTASLVSATQTPNNNTRGGCIYTHHPYLQELPGHSILEGDGLGPLPTQFQK